MLAVFGAGARFAKKLAAVEAAAVGAASFSLVGAPKESVGASLFGKAAVDALGPNWPPG